MRRIFALIVPAALLAAFALITPAQGQEGDDPEATLEITKVVDGEGPTGGYLIEYACDGTDEGGFGETLAFDAAGPDAPETQTVDIFSSGVTCTVNEVDDNGADSTTYACEFEDAAPAATVDDPEGRAPGSCIDDQTVQFNRFGETGTITVTNTFEADVIPDDEEPPPAVNPDVVTATPPFTG